MADNSRCEPPMPKSTIWDWGSEAVISPDGLYRYSLVRRWGNGPEATFVMLNPSTADAMRDDPTIRRCIGFARAWGMGCLYVGNLFAYRATDPTVMRAAPDPVGPENHYYLQWICYRAAKNGGVVVCAWGVHGSYMEQDETFMGWMDGLAIEPRCLGTTKAGAPRHPLFVARATPLVPYARRKARGMGGFSCSSFGGGHE